MKLDDIKKVAILGGGIIGSSFAVNYALKGMKVAILDINEEALKRAETMVIAALQNLKANAIIQDNDVARIQNNITYTTSMEVAVKDAQFVQENVRENYEDKQKIVAEFEKYASPECIYASSTSGLLISEISKYAKHPERFVGGHPYNPPHLIPLIEMTKSDKTDPAVLELAKQFYLKMGKEPVVLQKEALGFISNRLQQGVVREMAHLVMNGVCSVEDIDKALTFGPGLRWGVMGPLLVFELGGGGNGKGFQTLFTMAGKSVEMWLADMADFKKYPEGWVELAQKGINEAIANRPAEIGNDTASLRAYRDKMLIELLKLHKKL